MTIEESLKEFITVTKDNFLETKSQFREITRIMTEMFQEVFKQIEKLLDISNEYCTNLELIIEAIVRPEILELLRETIILKQPTGYYKKRIEEILLENIPSI